MNTPNFGSILDKPSSEVQRPKPLPQGSYIWLINGQPRYDKSAKKQTEFVEFNLKCLGTLQNDAGESDVDPDALDAALTKPSGEKVPLNEKTTRVTFYLTEDAIWRLNKFLTDCGIDGEDKSLRQMIDETPGCQVGGYLKHTASEDGEAVFANISKTFSVE